MGSIENIKEFLLFISALGALLGVILKIGYNFILDCVKLNYKGVPEEESSFEVILKIIIRFLASSEIVIILLICVSVIINPRNDGTQITKINPAETIFVILVCFLWILIGLQGQKIVVIYKEKVEKSLREKISDKLKNRNKYYVRIAYIFEILFIGAFFVGMDKFNCILILIVNSFFLLIATRIENEINTINNEYKYEFITSNGVIVTHMYLEYRKYYLIIEDGNERYIKKDIIKEIKKYNLDKI